MSKSIVEDLELGFVKQNPWVLRDRELRRAAARAETDQRMARAQENRDKESGDKESSDKKSDFEEIEYGPGYVKRLRDRFLALSKKSEASASAAAPAAALPESRAGIGGGKTRSESSNESEAKSALISTLSEKTASEAADNKSKEHSPENLEDQSTNAPRSMAAVLLEQIEKIGRELYRKTSITATQKLEEDHPELNSVSAIKQRFEPGSRAKAEWKTDHIIASQTRRDHEDVLITDLVCLSLSIEHSGLEEGCLASGFTVAEGISRPPPTPFPLPFEVFDFESTIRPSAVEHATESDDSASSGSRVPDETSWNGIEWDKTIRPPPVPDETPVREPDIWVKKPRRIPPPPRRIVNEEADCSALMEMKSILSKFQQRRSRSPEVEHERQPQRQGDPTGEILPNDPSPSAAPKDSSSSDEYSRSDDSFDFLSTSEEEPEPETLEKLERSDRLRPMKKRKVNFEIVGGGLVPKKTSLFQGPKFTRREIEFSEHPPKAYAYLEESLVSGMDEWVPGQELSMEQYREIRDEGKVERYKKFFASIPYYPPYEEAPTLTDAMATPAGYNSFYPPMTVDDVYLIKLIPPHPPPPPPPASFDPEWYIRPPPAYPFPTEQQTSLSTFAVPQK